MECIETASVIVSTNPDELPVIIIRKLLKMWMVHKEEEKRSSLFYPTRTPFLCPNSLEFADKVYSKLFLPKITTSLDNHRNTVPVG
jgi:hypothetical protein